MRITRVSPVSVAKVAFVLYAVLGLIIGGRHGVRGAAGSDVRAAHGEHGSAVFGVIFGAGAVIFMPLLYGGFGALGALIGGRNLQPRGRIRGRYRGDPRADPASPLMPRLIAQPTVVAAAGNKPKRIEEYAGHVNSGTLGRQRGADGVARRLVSRASGPDSRRSPWCCAAGCASQHEGGASRCRRGAGRRHGAGRVGPLLHARTPTARNTWPCALPAFRPRLCTAIRRRHGDTRRTATESRRSSENSHGDWQDTESTESS